MSTEELIRELETSGVLDHSGPPAKSPGPSQPQSTKAGRLRRASAPSSSLLLIVAVCLVALIGSVPFGSYALYPFSLFVTLIHETGHALAATLTGGAVNSLGVSGDLSGLTRTSGGLEALIAPAGYLGATLAGVGLLLTPVRFARWAIIALAAIPVLDLLMFHPADAFTAVWAVVFIVTLGTAAWKLHARWLAFLQLFLGVETGLNAFRDLTTLIFISGSSSHIHSDAENMSHALFGPPYVWAIVWTFLSVLLILVALVTVVRRDWSGIQRRRVGQTRSS